MNLNAIGVESSSKNWFEMPQMNRLLLVQSVTAGTSKGCSQPSVLNLVPRSFHPLRAQETHAGHVQQRHVIRVGKSLTDRIRKEDRHDEGRYCQRDS